MISSAVSRTSLSGDFTRFFQGRVDTQEANIQIREIGRGKVSVKGDATLVINPETGNVRVGQLDATATISGNTIYYNDGDCSLTITINGNKLFASDDNGMCGGMGVTFDGEYRRVGR